MSVRVMSWVFEHSQSAGNARLVLLAIADRANDDGSDAFPSVRWIADKSKVSERTAQRAIKHLVDIGELEVDANAGRRGANLYKVRMLRQIVTPDNVSPRQIDGVTPVTGRGDTGDTRTIPEPSTTPQPPASGGPKLDHCQKHTRFRNACDACKAARDSATAKPAWCGTCDERTRLLENDAGEVQGRCPICHPLRAAS